MNCCVNYSYNNAYEQINSLSTHVTIGLLSIINIFSYIFRHISLAYPTFSSIFSYYHLSIPLFSVDITHLSIAYVIVSVLSIIQHVYHFSPYSYSISTHISSTPILLSVYIPDPLYLLQYFYHTNYYIQNILYSIHF